MTLELDLRYFTRVPKAVTRSRTEGMITSWGYELLCYLHEHADRHTGVKRDFDANEFIEWLPSDDRENPRPSLRTVQRHMQSLAEAGWILSGYRKGHAAPYKVVLCNFRPANAKGVDGDADGDADKILINRSELKHWKETSIFRGVAQDGDGDGVRAVTRRCEGGERAANTTDSSDASDLRSNTAQAGELESGSATVAPVRLAASVALASSPGEESQNQQRGHKNLCDQLKAILYWLPESAPAASRHLLTLYRAEEIVHAVQDGMDRLTLSRDPAKIEKLFAKSGAAVEIRINEYRDHLKAEAERQKRERDRRVVAEKVAAEKREAAAKKAALEAKRKRLGEQWDKDFQAVRDDPSVDFDEWLAAHPPAPGNAYGNDQQDLKDRVQRCRVETARQVEQKARVEAEEVEKRERAEAARLEQEAAEKLAAGREEIANTMVCAQCGPNGYLVWIEDRGWKCESCDGLNVMPITPGAFALSESVVDEILRRIPSQDRSVAKKIYHEASAEDLHKIGIVRPS
jgi:hypothetical protein